MKDWIEWRDEQPPVIEGVMGVGQGGTGQGSDPDPDPDKEDN